MKLTKSKLKEIIREELLNEAELDDVVYDFLQEIGPNFNKCRKANMKVFKEYSKKHKGFEKYLKSQAMQNSDEYIWDLMTGKVGLSM